MVRNYTNLESDFMWQDILKAIEYLTESAIDVKVEDFKTAVEKGYPSVITPLTAVTEVNDGKIDGFTCFSDMGKFYFVGVAEVFDHAMGKGLFSKLLQERNNKTKGKPRITLLNPLTDRGRQIVTRMAEKLGFKVTEYSQVEDIMDEPTYRQMSILTMYRYPTIGEEVNSDNLERMAGAVVTTAPAHAKLFKPAYRTRKKKKVD